MESIVSVIVGVVFIAIGIANRKGNISMLHSYHTKRIKEEDKLPFGKIVGLGMMIIGGALGAFGGLTFLSTLLERTVYMVVGGIILAVGMVVGLALSFGAMIKYNKGIF